MEKVAIQKFQAILRSEQFKSLNENDLKKLPAYTALMNILPAKSRWRRYLNFALFVTFLAILTPIVTFVLVHNEFLTNKFLQAAHRETARLFLEEYLEFRFEKEFCLLEVVDGVEDMFRPPVDCSICRNVTEIERVSDITATEFDDKFAYSSRPVVIIDGMKDWTAEEKFSFEYFKDVYYNDSPTLDASYRECQFFPYKTSFTSLREVFAMSSERAHLKDGSKPWYIGWSNCDSMAANTLRQHYHRPYFLPSNSESSKTDWIFMGSPGYGAPMHIDNVELPSWQAQVRGNKRWILEPPPECYLQCQMLEVMVHPGEIIVLDTNRWFHQTVIEGDDLSITIGSEYD